VNPGFHFATWMFVQLLHLLGKSSVSTHINTMADSDTNTNGNAKPQVAGCGV
jgi:hypothetical protein